jgi:23S rRNA pseudouridine1911/1915/1917 synthase
MEKVAKLNRIYEDDKLLVIDKPAGLVVNRSNTAEGVTLQDVLEEEEDYFSEEYDEEFRSRSGIAHRLDKDTSGIMLIAKDFDTFYNLLEQFKTRVVKKEYVALVHGRLDGDQFEINAPIKRNPKHPLKFAVVSTGKEALTFVENVKTIVIDDNLYTLIRVFPKTGRTHQIRVHMAAMNHYVVGDPIYSPKSLLEISEPRFGRLMLHAHKITFKHPETKEILTFTSELPEEFKKL